MIKYDGMLTDLCIPDVIGYGEYNYMLTVFDSNFNFVALDPNYYKFNLSALTISPIPFDPSIDSEDYSSSSFYPLKIDYYAGKSPYSLVITDEGGINTIKTLKSGATDITNNQVIWDGREDDSDIVDEGCFMARITWEGHEENEPFLVLYHVGVDDDIEEEQGWETVCQ
ncbi:MAG: hypothetical protein AB1742_07640 [bacterium]